MSDEYEVKLKPHPHGWPVYILVTGVNSKEGTREDRVADWFSFFIVAVPPEGGCHCHWINQACPPYGGPATEERHLGPHWDHVNHVGSGTPFGRLIPWDQEVWTRLCRLQAAAHNCGKRLRYNLQHQDKDWFHLCEAIDALNSICAGPQCPSCGSVEDFAEGVCADCGVDYE